MAKKPAKIPSDSLTAIAGLGVELAILSDKVDAVADRVRTSEKRLDEAKSMPLHLIQVKQDIGDLKEAIARIEATVNRRPWWRVW